MGDTGKRKIGPSLRIITTAFVVGIISFAVFPAAVSFLFADSNSSAAALLVFFAPGLAAIFGTLVGGLIGIVWSALHAGERAIRAELWWLGGLWGLTLFDTFVTSWDLDSPAQGLVVATGIFLLAHSTTRRSLPEPARKYGPVVLCVAALIVLT